ncbi:MAG: cytochrome c-type biogenesis protein CcmH [Rhodospirillales bacterium]|nr:cytochrome c-type biogenesis protein CcmH [Rhodospirillales bacterium]
MRRLLLALALGLGIAGPSGAVQPGEELADPALEARARSLSREIRCLVCQNQSIDESEADLARDLRLIVRERIAAGDSDDAVKAFLVERYGDFVLLNPPVKPKTWLLWFGPAAILAMALGGAALYLRRRPKLAEAPPLDAAERVELDRLMAEAEREEPRP